MTYRPAIVRRPIWIRRYRSTGFYLVGACP